MISEGSSQDPEDLRNGCWKFSFAIPGINLIFNCNHISQYHCIFDQMQPVNISVTDNLTDPKHLNSSVQYLVYGVVLEPKNHQQCFHLSNYMKKTD